MKIEQAGMVGDRPRAASVLQIAASKRLSQAKRRQKLLVPGGEHGVDSIAGPPGEIVALHSIVGLGMTGSIAALRCISCLIALATWCL